MNNMTIYELVTINNIRRGLAEERFCASIHKRLAELGRLYINSINSVTELAVTKDDYDLLISATVDMYNHEVETLKQLCKLHNVSKENFNLLFNGIGGEL